MPAAVMAMTDSITLYSTHIYTLRFANALRVFVINPRDSKDYDRVAHCVPLQIRAINRIHYRLSGMDTKVCLAVVLVPKFCVQHPFSNEVRNPVYRREKVHRSFPSKYYLTLLAYCSFSIGSIDNGAEGALVVYH